jgi:hypothetical protein
MRIEKESGNKVHANNRHWDGERAPKNKERRVADIGKDLKNEKVMRIDMMCKAPHRRKRDVDCDCV